MCVKVPPGWRERNQTLVNWKIFHLWSLRDGNSFGIQKEITVFYLFISRVCWMFWGVLWPLWDKQDVTFTTVAAFHCCARWLRLLIWDYMMFIYVSHVNMPDSATPKKKHQQMSNDRCSFCGNSSPALFLLGSYCKILVIITSLWICLCERNSSVFSACWSGLSTRPRELSA